MCIELLGDAPDVDDMYKGRLKIRWLSDRFHRLSVGADHRVVQCYVRAHIMMHIGGWLFADKSCSKVKLMFLPLLRDLGRVGRFSWGSAVLATLYRHMCVAMRTETKEIGGPLILLQVLLNIFIFYIGLRNYKSNYD